MAGRYRKDIILIAVLILAAAAMLAVRAAVNRRADDGGSGRTVRIIQDGELYGTYPADKDREIVVENPLGRNVIRIEAGKVYMQEADCPDRYCISHGLLKGAGDAIVCLPHRLVVEPGAGGEAGGGDTAATGYEEEADADALDAIVR